MIRSFILWSKTGSISCEALRLRRCDTVGALFAALWCCAPTQHTLFAAHQLSTYYALRSTQAQRTAQHTRTHAHAASLSLPRKKNSFLNSGFLILLSGKEKMIDSLPPSLCGHSLLNLIQYFTHSAFSGLGTGTVVASNDGGSISFVVTNHPS